jgi:glycogen debranching enzyme
MDDIIRVRDRYYILAETSLADAPTHALMDGDLFAVFDGHGDIRPLGFESHGLFFRGTRFLSRLHLKINGKSPLLLSSGVKEANDLLVVDLTNPDFGDGQAGFVERGTIHIVKTVCLGGTRCLQRTVVSNYGVNPVRCTLTFEFDADYADIFEVRGMCRPRRGERIPPKTGSSEITLGYRGLDGVTRRTRIEVRPGPDRIDPGALSLDLELEPQEERTVDFTASCLEGGAGPSSPDRRKGHRPGRETCRDLEGRGAPLDTGSEPFNDWIHQSWNDLRMLLTETGQGLYPYAGIPWYSTVFGRDGIITALETLWIRPEIARGVLLCLARVQAEREDPAREAEPGKILHERRDGEMAALGEIPFGLYYGSIDATPLFVVLAGAYFERTGDLDFLRSIWPHVEAAVGWIDRYGDLDGDGFVEYGVSSGKGLVNQGWKDSEDSVFHAGGALAEPPIALAEVQGYVYEALGRAARAASALGAHEQASGWYRAAESLRTRFLAAFWCEEIGMYAEALDGAKRPCAVRSSNAGHCLFSGIADRDHARRLAEILTGEGFFTGWGIRTIARGEARYNPMSYHNGSVWPHDNALIAYGLGRYGHRDAAVKVMTGLFDASRLVRQHRLPELFCGFDRRAGEGPTLYPIACDPQAWAAGAVFLLLQACLGLKIDAPANRIVFDNPILPPFLPEVNIRDLRVNEAVVDITLERRGRDVAVNVRRKVGDVDVIARK